MEPKEFLIYIVIGVLHVHRVIMDKNNTLPIAWSKIIHSMVFIKYPHEGIAFHFRFELLIFGGKERFIGLNV
jgi:hypothetical protein